MPVDVGALLDHDAHARPVSIGSFHIVADTPFGGHIRDISLHRLRVHARRVAHIRVTVGICIGAGHII